MYLSQAQLDQIITSNQRLFFLGSVISNQWLCSTFNISIPNLDVDNYETLAADINTFNLRRAYWYTRLNNRLSHYGLVIRQSTNRHTKEVSYIVQSQDGVQKRLAAYTTARTVKTLQRRNLSLGYKRYQGQLTGFQTDNISR